MIFLWGIENNYVDITETCFHRYLFGDNIIIPESEEERLSLFGDPAPTIVKHIKVIDKFNSYKIFEGNNEIRINKDIIFGKKFLWGIENNYVDITETYFYKYLFGDDIIIPESEDERLNLFGDLYIEKMEDLKDDLLSLPMYPELSENNVLKVCHYINNFK